MLELEEEKKRRRGWSRLCILSPGGVWISN
jgi:hypothetical protein